MIGAARRLVHACFRACGFEIMSIKNIDAALEERGRQRRLAYAQQFAQARRASRHDMPRSRTERSAGVDVLVAWVSVDDVRSSVCTRLRPATSVLDIGCGINPQPFIEADIHICCEPYEPYMRRLRAEHADEKQFVCLECDIQKAIEIFPERSVDTVVVLEVIEHMEKEQAQGCLPQLCGLAKSQVLISTPIGFMPQDDIPGQADPWDMDGGKWQQHKSAWQPEDFPASEGWEVVACRDFHRKDAHGKRFDKPVGAMWAIKTITNEPEETSG